MQASALRTLTFTSLFVWLPFPLCPALLCSALLYAALRCSTLRCSLLRYYYWTCGIDFASNSPPCRLSNTIGRPLPRCSEVWYAVRGAWCPAPVWVEAAHGPFVLFLISLFVPEHVHVHVHLHGAQRVARGGGHSRKRRLGRLSFGAGFISGRNCPCPSLTRIGGASARKVRECGQPSCKSCP
ncbi:uncharacterized protein K444DRAFT_7391 [Hyaloscypha bicolor E]|uniref:Uncharacterized protein n=1 Tax=Hyaloscypha bicolor E TaxID=1095630 RepID=A0A2J6TVW5_9HELO|nr:uncharacterized protein K444DRAFT_7391 [Hyaloscypha bicolor E]PMD67163.1 hypothetical protein K444DRAFT_7391 [Hyaloscypha bicolor E]